MEDRTEDFDSEEKNMNINGEQQDILKVNNSPLAISNSKSRKSCDFLFEIPLNDKNNSNRCNSCKNARKIKNKISKRQKYHSRCKIIIKVVKNSK